MIKIESAVTKHIQVVDTDYGKYIRLSDSTWYYESYDTLCKSRLISELEQAYQEFTLKQVRK